MLAKYSFLSNELSARVSCETTALTWFGCVSKPVLQYGVPTHNKQTTNHEEASALPCQCLPEWEDVLMFSEITV